MDPSADASRSKFAPTSFLPLQNVALAPVSCRFAVEAVPVEQALAFTNKPHLMVEASQPYRVVHANAAFHQFKMQRQERQEISQAMADSCENTQEERSAKPLLFSHLIRMAATHFTTPFARCLGIIQSPSIPLKKYTHRDSI
jgi:hypothetical protein